VNVDATEWNERYAKTELEWGAQPNRFLVQEVDGLRPGRALDIAAGEGRNALWLAERGWVVTAVDFSSVAIDKGRRLAAERGLEVEWLVADVVPFDPGLDRFDLVIAFYLHLVASEMQKVLAKAAASLRENGTLLIVGHDSTNPVEGVGGPQDPTILHDPDELISDLEGLIVEKAGRVLRPVPGADRSAIDTLVRARRSSSDGGGSPISPNTSC
jgi:SAM-dependent methyltransferase